MYKYAPSKRTVLRREGEVNGFKYNDTSKAPTNEQNERHGKSRTRRQEMLKQLSSRQILDTIEDVPSP